MINLSELEKKVDELKKEIEYIKSDSLFKKVDSTISRITKLKIAAEEVNLKPVRIKISGNLFNALQTYTEKESSCVNLLSSSYILGLQVTVDRATYDCISLEVQ